MDYFQFSSIIYLYSHYQTHEVFIINKSGESTILIIHFPTLEYNSEQVKFPPPQIPPYQALGLILWKNFCFLELFCSD